ncbi:hypothetical protein [Staphylococcus agnetis]|uniref:Uncharacterized protein n=1 Tax=Staphylococcus agnetis TaxID=985762 RepID=A0AAW9YR51_9STAP|nr:hypothetical protein [Staphylococcus agnetis]NJI01592.1 hypothetical protein [Staphylococcus agnetis]
MRKNAIEKINSKNKKLVANLDYDEEPKKRISNGLKERLIKNFNKLVV